MDVLSDVLKSVRLCGSMFFTAEFSFPWALESPNRDLLARLVMPRADHVLLFHILTEGECIVECQRSRIAMESGDIVVVPHGHSHTMRKRREGADQSARSRRVTSVGKPFAARTLRRRCQSPMKYLACWRMQLAKELLRDREDNIQIIAERLGYESEPAFSRAFKKVTGHPPAAWRGTAAQLSAER